MRISNILWRECLLALTVLLTYQTTQAQSNVEVYHLHKCFCDASQVNVNSKCQEQETTFNLMVNSLQKTTKKLKSKKANNVTVSDVSCPSRYFEIILPGDEFAFMEDGSIMHLKSDISLSFTEYCLEHYTDEQNNIFSQIKICLRVPQIQVCCQDSSHSDCGDESQTSYKLPVWIGNTVEEIPVLGVESTFICEDEETINVTHTLMTHDISPYGARLAYTKEGPILSYSMQYMSGAEIFDPKQFCISHDPLGGWPQATFCYKDPMTIYSETCSNSICISKCCPKDMLFSYNDLGCTQGIDAEIWKPSFYHGNSYQELLSSDSHNSSGPHHVLHGYPICGNGSYFLDPDDLPETVIKLLDNGRLYEQGGHTFWDQLEYCLDNFKDDNIISEKALVCYKVASQQEVCDQVTNIAYPILLIISAICLALTIVVYLWVPDLSSKIQGKSLVSSILALLAAYICLIVAQLAGNQFSETSCSVIALCMQYSFLASFFWLNIMSYDIWRTFRCLKIRKESPSSSRRRFICYSIYSWGCPLIIVIVTAVMQFLPEQEGEGDIVRPKFTETTCAFFTQFDQRASWAYFYGFITLILIANSFFFLHLAWILFKAQKVSENALGRRNQHYTEWAKLYLKLFVVMGVTWIFEVISHVEGSCSLWIVTDIINTLRGVFIFVIFICKQDTLKKIRTRGSPAISSIRTTFATSSSFFSRSSKRASSLYTSTNEPTSPRPTEELNFLPSDERI